MTEPKTDPPPNRERSTAVDHTAEFASSPPAVTSIESEDLEYDLNAELTDATAGRYTLLGEIAQGGMGAVIKGHDPNLGRELALKILLSRHRDRRDLIDRFVEEAQICGQLQHPGIVPVYELGTLNDRRPFFAMKLVQGQTLAELLEARHTPEDDLPRFLNIFEAICQTVAYAHARGVIHRDLKPSNVMVGAFGEVQVMDWGLAKVLAREDDSSAGHVTSHVTASLLSTARTRGDTDLSESGSIMGTPAYMAPEQARGENEKIDRRADVFSLGSILCELLTGIPAYSGETASAIILDAGRGETAAALERLRSCRADEELLDLARDCLVVEIDGRPSDAGVVARRITAYLAGVQERLRDAELARAAEEARVVEAEAKAAAEGRARRLTRALAATVLLGGGVLAVGWRWVELDRLHRASEATARVNVALRVATRLRGAAQGAHVGELAPWDTAEAAVEKASDLLEDGVDPVVRRHVLDLASEVAREHSKARAVALAADRDRRLLDRFADIRSARVDDRLGDLTDAAYGEAFREAGLDPDALPPAEVGRLIRERPPATAAGMGMALDDWAAVRQSQVGNLEGSRRLTAAARFADTDPWRGRLRDALDISDRDARRARLLGLIGSIPDKEVSPLSFDLLGKALGSVGARVEAEEVLRRGHRLHPNDLWLNYDLAQALEKLGLREQSLRYYTAARVIRPETAHELAHALAWKGESEDAIAVFRDLVRIRPQNGRHLLCLGDELRDRGHRQEARQTLGEAITVLRKTIGNRPNDYYAHLNLGMALQSLSDLDPIHSISLRTEAIEELRHASRINPTEIQALTMLAMNLSALQRGKEAQELARRAVVIAPDNPSAHHALGVVQQALGQLDEAITSFHEAIRLAPDHGGYHGALSSALSSKGRLEEAVAEAREAVRLNPDNASELSVFGYLLLKQRHYDEAMQALRAGLRNNPENDGIMNLLAWILCTAPEKEKRDPHEALDLARKAVELAPQSVTNVNTLGVALYRAGQLAEAISVLQRSASLNHGRDCSDWFFLSMAQYQRGEPGEAFASFVRGVFAMRSFPQEETEYEAFWAEASALFGALGPGPTPFQVKTDPQRALASLRRAVAAGNVNQWQLKEDPALAPLRSSSEFPSLLKTAKPDSSPPR